jgi:hypothetical protein
VSILLVLSSVAVAVLGQAAPPKPDASATVATLFFVPVVFSFLHRRTVTSPSVSPGNPGLQPAPA